MKNQVVGEGVKNWTERVNGLEVQSHSRSNMIDAKPSVDANPKFGSD